MDNLDYTNTNKLNNLRVNYEIFISGRKYIFHFKNDEDNVRENIKTIIFKITKIIINFLKKENNLKISQIIENFHIDFVKMQEPACYKYNGDFENVFLDFCYEKIKNYDEKKLIALVEHELYHIISYYYKYDREITQELVLQQKKLKIDSNIRQNKDKDVKSESLKTFINLLDNYEMNFVSNEIYFTNYLFYKNFQNVISDAYLTILAQSEKNKNYLEYVIKNDKKQINLLKKKVEKYKTTTIKLLRKYNNEKCTLFIKKSNLLILFIMACNHCPRESISLIHSNEKSNFNETKEVRKMINDYFNYLKSIDRQLYHLFYNFYFYFLNSINIIDEHNNQFIKEYHNNEKIRKIIEKKIDFNKKQIIEISKKSLVNYHNIIENLIKEINSYFN
ncbi:MAG: hypothetical protein PHT94_01465 [Candidatus Nanoarchaeia archaeon]|nr:hypothetical protein [Candidatus Nanoarchaeia archaeon]